jgi:protein-L-isoaspartate(D-aspartate) O-methyltransferase
LPTLFVPMTGVAEAGREIKPDPANPRIANGGFEELAQDSPPEKPAPDKLAPEKPPAGLAPNKSSIGNGAAQNPAATAPNEPGPIVAPQSTPIVGGEPTPIAAPSIAAVGKPNVAAALRPVGWHYQRQLEVVESNDAPQGKHYARFVNVEPGRASRGLQGMAVDGRRVAELDFSLWVRVERAQAGRSEEEVPVLGIVFYDENRALLSGDFIGPWLGTFPWRHEHAQVRVPPQAREAVLRIGMHGGVGELDLDDIQVTAVHRK